MERLVNSIRLRLALTTTLVIAIFGALGGGISFVWIGSSLEQEAEGFARHEAGELGNVIASARTPADLEERRLLLDALFPEEGVVALQVWSLGGERLLALQGDRPDLLQAWTDGLSAARRGELPVERLDTQELRTASLVRYANEPRWLVVAVVRNDHAAQVQAHFLRRYGLGLGVALALAFLGSTWLILHAFAPLHAMVRDAQTLTASGLKHRLAVPPRGSELRDLALLINHMLTQIEGTIRRLERFTSYAGHELRTPLARIRADAELALQEPGGEREGLEDVLEEVDMLRRVVDGLLELARGEPVDLDREGSFRLGDVVDELVEQAQLLGAEREVHVTHTGATDCTARGSRPMISRALWNLLDNSLKFVPRGGHVQVRVRPTEQAIDVEVADDGPGLEHDDVEALFEPFQRGRAPSEVDGHGLGLALSRSIARRHGGDLLALPPDAELRGARLCLRLPRPPAS